MNGAEVRAHVRAAVERGELPAGGPSDLAARDLHRDLSTWATGAATRIRNRVMFCSCVAPDDEADDTTFTRCGRCYGLVKPRSPAARRLLGIGSESA
jgi:hypothetical protein